MAFADISLSSPGSFADIALSEGSIGALYSSTIGSEEISNSEFTSDTAWDKLGGTTISGGVANVVALGSLGYSASYWSLHQHRVFVYTYTYKIEFDVKQTSGSGNFQVAQGYAVRFNEAITSSWTHKVVVFQTIFNDTSEDAVLSIGGLTASDTFQVDNVTVKKITNFPQGVATVTGTLHGGKLSLKGLIGTGSLRESTLKAYWKLDETSGQAYDSTSNDHDSTTNTATINQSGKIGTSFYYATDVDTIIPDHADWDLTTTDSATFLAWVKISADPISTWGNIIGDDAGPCLQIKYYTDNYYILLYYDGATSVYSDVLYYDPAVWYFVTCVKSGLAVSFYRNGVYVGGGNHTQNATPDTWTIGNDPVNEAFPGYLDEIGYWKGKAFTAAEVMMLYNGGSGLTHPFAVTSSVTGTLAGHYYIDGLSAGRAGGSLLKGLVYYWKFDELSGNAADSAGSNTGTVNNITQGEDGKISDSFLFKGVSSSYVGLTDIIPVSGCIFTWSAWLKWDNTQANAGTVFGSNGSARFMVTTGGQPYYFEGSSYPCGENLVNGTWALLTFTCSAIAGKWYMDGDYVNTIAIIPDIDKFNQIGYSHSDLYYYKGNIDEFAYYSRELTAQEVAYLYNAGSGLTHPFTSLGIYAELTGEGSLVGATDGVAIISGTLSGEAPSALIGITAGVTNVSGTLLGVGVLAGSTDGIASLTGTLTAEGILTGTTTGVASVSGTLTGKLALVGASDGITLLTGILVGTGTLAGSINAPFTITDNFDSYNTSSINGQGNWIVCLNSISIYDNSGDKSFYPSSGDINTYHMAYYNQSANANQSSKVTLDATAADLYVGAAVRVSTNGNDAYFFTAKGATPTRWIEGRTGGTPFDICVSYSGGNNVAGDTFEITVIGSKIIAYKNGAIDTLLGDAISPATGTAGIYYDTRVTSGYVGIECKGNSNTQRGDNWVGLIAIQVVGILAGKLFFAGSTTGVASVSGALAGQSYLVASSAGIASVSGILTATGTLIGATDGVALLTGILKGKGILSGSTNGIASLIGILQSKGILAGATNGIATTTGTISGESVFSGTTNGIAVVSGTLKGEGVLAGITDGITDVSGVLIGIGTIAGSTAGQATCTLIGYLKGYITGTTNGVAIVSGILVGTGKLYGTTDGVATTSGFIPAEDQLYGTTTGVAVVSGTLIGTGQLQGITASVSLLSGEVIGWVCILGSSASFATVTGTIYAKAHLGGTTGGTSTCIATLLGTGQLEGITNGVATAILVSSGIIPASGAINGTTSITGILFGRGQLISLIDCSSLISGSLFLKWKEYATGSIVTYSQLTATLLGTGELGGITEGIADVTGNLSYPGMLKGTVAGVATCMAIVNGWAEITASIYGVAVVIGTMWSHLVFEEVSGTSLITIEFAEDSTITLISSGDSTITTTITQNSIII